MPLASFDFFGSIVGIMYKGHWRYKSNAGGGLTLLTGICCLSLLMVYSIKFLVREEPRMSFTDLKFIDPPDYVLSSNFSIAIMMKFGDRAEYRKEVIDVEILHHYQSKQYQNQSSHLIEPVKCVKQMFPGSEEFFDQFDLNSGICFPPLNLTLTGNSVSHEYSYITIKFIMCRNSQQCLQEDQIKNFFKEKKPTVVIYFFDTAYEVYRLDNPVTKIIYPIEVNLSYFDSKETDLYFAANGLIRYDGYFFNSYPTTFSNYMIDTIRDFVSMRSDSTKELLLVNLKSSSHQNQIVISYMKFSELLAQVGALSNIIILIFGYLTHYVNHFNFQNDLINGLYVFEDKDLSREKKVIPHKKPKSDINVLLFEGQNSRLGAFSQKKDINIFLENQQFSKKQPPKCNKIKPVELKLLSPAESYLNPINNSERLEESKIIQNAFKLVYRKKPKERFNQWDILIIALCPWSGKLCSGYKEKIKMFNLIKNKIASFQDYSNLFKKVQEVDLLKYLLLNDDELALFKIIPKPEFVLQEISNSSSFNDFSRLYNDQAFHYLKSHEEIYNFLNLKEVKGSLMRIFEKREKSPIDEKLIKLIGDNINI